eukprot:CAMPEP_0194071142 /NCGR_PEP_ID=MMETSP0009_2-20130614/88551_1 /TAXON_ID=210454 /ORGANISM="Grammatophora oceanica, Strain CCMP 410" /LENGTH=47 /DNA_ID= /DNA_START= /DNA_END= /DNA_ORIENTATION=
MTIIDTTEQVRHEKVSGNVDTVLLIASVSRDFCSNKDANQAKLSSPE